MKMKMTMTKANGEKPRVGTYITYLYQLLGCRGIKNHLSPARDRRVVEALPGTDHGGYSIKRPVKLNVNTRDY